VPRVSKAKMSCPYCQHPVVFHEHLRDTDDHRWCFIHLAERGLIKGITPEEARDSFYALSAANIHRKVKPRKVNISREQRRTTVPGSLYS
jgi:hypothetical protein